MTFYMENISKVKKNQKGAKVNFTLLLHILPRWPTGLSLFAYLKGNLNSGFFHDFLLTICIFKDIKMKVRLKSMGFQLKSREKSIKNEQNQPLPVWGGPLECRYTVIYWWFFYLLTLPFYHQVELFDGQHRVRTSFAHDRDSLWIRPEW